MTLPLERHWKNVGWALGVETFWGISLALISVVAIVPVFLSHLGASNTVLGALPAIWTLMVYLPGPFGSHFTSHLPLRKQAVFVFHALSCVPWLLMAAWFWFGGGAHRPALDIAIFLILWGGSWGFMGLFMPVWINFIGKVTRPELRATSFGVIFFFQTLMGVFGGWAANRILASPLPFPQNYALGFLIAGVCMTLGAFFFFPIVEDPGATAPQGEAVSTVIAHIREVLADRGGVRVYLSLMVLTVGGWLLVSYYAVYAEKRFALRAQDSAIFTAVCMAGQMLGSLVTGVVGDRFGYAKVAAVSAITLTLGLATAIWGTHPMLYYVTAFLAGIYLVTDRLAQFNLSMAFCPHEDNTAWLGAIPAITAPVVAIVAGSAGSFIDHFGFPPVAMVGLALALCASYLALFRLKEPAFSLAGRRNAT
jgi:predicted MFS family arabinose efflux permease